MKNFILLFTLIFSFSCSSDEFEKDDSSYDGPVETITHNGVDRKYIIYTPQGYDGTSKLPLLLNSNDQDLIFIGGSNFTVSEIL